MPTDELVKQIRDAVMNEIVTGRTQLEKDDHDGFGLFIAVEDNKGIYNQLRDYQFICSVSECSGGAWQQFATGEVHDEHITVKIKTVFGIMAHKSINEEFSFYTCDPSFPDNVINFLHEAARNAKHTFRLSHKRGWAKHTRNMRKTSQNS